MVEYVRMSSLIRPFAAATKVNSYRRLCCVIISKISHLANPRIPQMADAAQRVFLYTESEMKGLKSLSTEASPLTNSEMDVIIIMGMQTICN